MELAVVIGQVVSTVKSAGVHKGACCSSISSMPKADRMGGRRSRPTASAPGTVNGYWLCAAVRRAGSLRTGTPCPSISA